MIHAARPAANPGGKGELVLSQAPASDAVGEPASWPRRPPVTAPLPPWSAQAMAQWPIVVLKSANEPASMIDQR